MKATDSLCTLRATFLSRMEEWEAVINAAPLLFLDLEAQEVEPSFDIHDGSINLRFAGDQQRFYRVWKLLRTYGFAPSCRPAKGEPISTFCTFFRGKIAGRKVQLWFDFSSTICRLKRVGTKMVEQAVYEVECS